MCCCPQASHCLESLACKHLSRQTVCIRMHLCTMNAGMKTCSSAFISADDACMYPLLRRILMPGDQALPVCMNVHAKCMYVHAECMYVHAKVCMSMRNVCMSMRNVCMSMRNVCMSMRNVCMSMRKYVCPCAQVNFQISKLCVEHG
jgi:hypothetical protein